MMGRAAVIHDKFFALSAERAPPAKAMPTKQAWAYYARNRWPENTVKHLMAEFDLSDGQARGIVYAQGSQSAIDQCLGHRNGGPLLELDMLLVRWRMKADELAQHIDERDAHERQREEARRQSRRMVTRSLAAHKSFDPSAL